MPTTQIPSLEEMLEAGVHFGHRTRRWHPKMKQYIFDVREGVHIINLEETYIQLEKAIEKIEEFAKEESPIIIVGTKRQASEVVKKAAQDAGVYFVTERWPGGLITNFENIKKTIDVYTELSDKIDNKGVLETVGNKEKYQLLKERARLEKLVGGLVGLEKPPALIVVIDPKREKTAVLEARKTNTPTIGIIDTNADPDMVDFPIPANDDALKSIELILDTVAKAIKKNKKA